MAAKEYRCGWVLGLLFLCLSSCKARNSCKAGQRDALLRIETFDYNGWNVAIDCCSWTGVSCDPSGNVITLDLGNSYDNRTLSHNSAIFDLPFLQSLTLGDSEYDGITCSDCTIPNEIHILRNLRKLVLYSFGGTIPSSIGRLTLLESLILPIGQLSGNIPDSIGNLHRLTLLDLSFNELSGRIPQSLRNLTQLEFLYFSQNNLSGNLPSFVFNFPNMSSLDLSMNRLEGSLPTKIQSDAKLEVLYLDHNRLHGIVPLWPFYVESLKTLRLSGNRFNGPIGEFVKPRVSSLSWLDLADNRIDKLPRSLRYLKSLKALNAEGNKLKEFPNYLNTLDSLDSVNIGDNRIKGRTDFSKGWKGLRILNASYNYLDGPLTAPPPSLQFLMLSHNHFTGDVPESYCKLSELDLSFNNLSGTIQWNSSTCSNSPMSTLSLGSNNLHGAIPDVFSNVHMLLLHGNNFGFKLPRSLANATDLFYLDVSSNNIVDVFPHWLESLAILIISSNSFYGNIATPKSYQNLMILDASDNKFTGFIPANLFILPETISWNPQEYDDQVSVNFQGSRTSLRDVSRDGFFFVSRDFSRNQFSGKIPSAVGNMSGLVNLNLNNNNLSGSIPSSFVGLSSIESLDLSSNMLSGQIPKELAELQYLVFLNLSYNLLEGAIPVGMLFSNASYTGNKGLCGLPLSVIC